MAYPALQTLLALLRGPYGSARAANLSPTSLKSCFCFVLLCILFCFVFCVCCGGEGSRVKRPPSESLLNRKKAIPEYLLIQEMFKLGCHCGGTPVSPSLQTTVTQVHFCQLETFTAPAVRDFGESALSIHVIGVFSFFFFLKLSKYILFSLNV